jgi:alpha-beta hydrolase superfamily lysophospholipase
MNTENMNLKMALTGTQNGVTTFPIVYYQLHPDVSLNFQMNRFYNWINDESMLDEMRAISPRIHTYDEYTREFIALAEKVLASGQKLKAAYYLRAAEFFLFPDDPAKLSTRERFLSLVREHYGIKESDMISIPYENGILSAYRFTPAQSKETLVLFGGFDSYIEEFFALSFAFRDAGYEVIIFEGPGQGGALEDSHLPMTHEWEKPVKTVLDFFHLDDVTLMGISLGGYLVMRAAAFEPRVHRVIADDILSDFFEVVLRKANPVQRALLRALLSARAARQVNALVERAMKRNLQIEWGIKQGMHVTGSQTPFDFLQKMRLYRTGPFSSQVSQDVLLMAGSEDHYVPLHQFYDQIATLKHVRSLTARLFTRWEQAQNHCQIGNIGLSVRVIVNWLDSMQDRGKEALP